jgi:hypothetical protein
MDLQTILNNLSLEATTFYKQPRGDQKGVRFSMGVTLVKGGKCQLNLTPTYDGITSGRPQKGVKQYEYAKKVDFSLEPHECNSIAAVIPALVNGNYENPAAEKPFKNTFQIEHYPSGGKSRLLLYRPQSSTGSIPTISMTIMPSKDSGLEKVSFTFNPSELKMFSDFVKKCGSELPFYSSLFHGFAKMLKSSIAIGGNNTDSEDRKTSGNSHITSEEDYPESYSDAQPVSTTSSVEEYNWDFN